jgi:hypothetical protein
MSIRIGLIYSSLAIVFLTFVAFLSGPLWGLRLDYEKGQQFLLIQIIVPTFVSFLSSAGVHATSEKSFPEPRGQKGRILRAIYTSNFFVRNDSCNRDVLSFGQRDTSLRPTRF